MTAHPLAIHTDVVRPEWIDYNGHMNDGYYVVAFTLATDAVQDHVGLNAVYRQQTNCSIYTVEAHLTYKHEVKVGTQLRFESLVLGVDAKRLHLFHTMINESEGFVAATHELMLLHVDRTAAKVAPMPADIIAKLEVLAEKHAQLAQPPEAGRQIKRLSER